MFSRLLRCLRESRHQTLCLCSTMILQRRTRHRSDQVNRFQRLSRLNLLLLCSRCISSRLVQRLYHNHRLSAERHLWVTCVPNSRVIRVLPATIKLLCELLNHLIPLLSNLIHNHAHRLNLPASLRCLETITTLLVWSSIRHEIRDLYIDHKL